MYILLLAVLPDWPCNFSIHPITGYTIPIYSHIHMPLAFFLGISTLEDETPAMSQNVGN
jgi:hypothetical protein